MTVSVLTNRWCNKILKWLLTHFKKKQLLNYFHCLDFRRRSTKINLPTQTPIQVHASQWCSGHEEGASSTERWDLSPQAWDPWCSPQPRGSRVPRTGSCWQQNSQLFPASGDSHRQGALPGAAEKLGAGLPPVFNLPSSTAHPLCV